MFEKGPLLIRHAVVTMLDAFAKTAQETAAKNGGKVDSAEIARIGEAMKNSGEIENFYRAVFGQVVASIVESQNQNRRINAFGRLVAHPLGDFFQSRHLDRALLHNFFFFVQALVGEAESEWNAVCAAVLDEMRDKAGDAFAWESYYGDPRTQAIFWRVLVRIAQSFKRFDARRDWFLRIMQHKQTTVSLAPNKYVQLGDGLDVAQFGKDEFLKLFDSLFAPVKTLTLQEVVRFEAATGLTPKAAFDRFLGDLDRYRRER
jgi:hypothetical protein